MRGYNDERRIMNLEQYKKEYLQLIKKRSNHCKTKYIYGAGKYGRAIFWFLQEQGIQADGFVVTDSALNPDQVCGRLVFGIDKLKEKSEDTLFVIGMKSRWNSEIIKTLKSFGYNNYVEAPEHIDLLSDTMDRFERPALEITPKIGCSVNCRYCPQDILCKKYFNLDKKQKDMSLEEFKICVDKTPDNCLIYFAGFVEPFLNSEAVEMIRYSTGLGREVALYTTLVGLTVQKLSLIKDIPFFEVVLHIPDKDNYANIPMTDEYFELLDKVINMQKVNGKPFIDIANCQGEPHPEIVRRTKGKLTISSELGDRAGLLEGEELYRISNIQGKIGCRRAKNIDHFVLLPNGEVILCCNDFGLKHRLGNLLEQSYEEIIGGEPLRLIKQSMSCESGNEIICRNCMYAVKI